MKRLAFFMFLLTLFSCVSVPKNAPLLNQRVSEGISELKRQHVQSINHIYSLAIERVDKDFDKFLKKAKEMFKDKYGHDPSAEQDYYKVSIIAFKIRNRVLFEIRSNLEEVKSKIEENYDVVENINNEVTQYLYSAVKAKALEQSILDSIKKDFKVDLGIGKQISKLDKIIEKILKEGEIK